ncbi:type II toxin-antitoxin system RelE/ParE family toxin, partial [Xanthomonas fragariae]
WGRSGTFRQRKPKRLTIDNRPVTPKRRDSNQTASRNPGAVQVARDGGGKSSGYRVIVSCATDSHVFFLHGFPKNKKDNISPKELKALQALGKVLSGLGEQEIQKAVEDGAIEEVQDDREQRQEN